MICASDMCAARMLGEMDGDPLAEPLCDLALGEARPILSSALRHQMNGVVIAAKCATIRRYVIGQDPVAAFALELCLREVDQILGFRGKPDDQFRALGSSMRHAL